MSDVVQIPFYLAADEWQREEYPIVFATEESSTTGEVQVRAVHSKSFPYSQSSQDLEEWVQTMKRTGSPVNERNAIPAAPI